MRRNGRGAWSWGFVLWCACAAAGCRPTSVADAEAKGDVGWLDADGTADAVAALGRLADRDGKARRALEERARFDVNAYIAAWNAAQRGAPWGGELLRAGLHDPTRAEVAASAMNGREPAAAPFVADLEAGMQRVAASAKSNTLATVLAAIGAPARAAVVRRLEDDTTRGSMCGGIATPVASADAKAALREVPEGARDDAACVGTVISLAAVDDATLAWLATDAEPGLLGAASREKTIPCARLHTLWAQAIAARPPAQFGAMAVPLSHAVKRCPTTMDGVLADALKTSPHAHAAVVAAIDPFSGEDASLKATCATLPLVLRGPGSPIVKERASDALAHGCRGVP